MQSILGKIAKRHFLVVGDLMLDHYLWGDATRISPEAPVPVVKADHETLTAGGAANVALNLRALGAGVELAGAIGRDEAGRELTGVLEGAGVSLDKGLADAGRRTILKTRVMCRNQQLCRIDWEDGRPSYALPPEWIRDVLPGKIREADAIILSDYAKGVLTSDLIREIQSLADGKLVSLDPKPRAALSFRGLDLITPNRAEALQLARIQPPAQGEPFPADEVCRALHDRYATRLLVITLGADGMLLSRGGVPLRQIPTAARAVFDVSGAGDTVNAVLTAALAVGAEPEKAAELANHAAGVVVEKIGTATASPAEILSHASL